MCVANLLLAFLASPSLAPHPPLCAGGLLQWPSTDMIEVYCVYVPGLASLLRVSEAVAAVQDIQRRGLPVGDEVSWPLSAVAQTPLASHAQSAQGSASAVRSVPGLLPMFFGSGATPGWFPYSWRGVQVPFGHVVDCPTCQRPLAVVQPQYGRQVVPCSDCRYKFELVSGDLVTCDSESLL